MRYKRFISIFLTCMFLFSYSLTPMAAVEISNGDMIMPRVSGSLDHTLPAKTITPIDQQFTLDAGDIIKYDCTYTPKSASLDFGFIAPDGLFYSINCTTGSINKSIEVSQTGYFRLAIRNNASYSVTVTGTVKY